MANKFPHPFKDFLRELKKYRNKLPMKVSGIAEKEFKGNFRRQGYRGDSGAVVKWKKRSPKSKRTDTHAILIDKGRLRKGFKKRPDYNTARVINDVPYAQPNNEGDHSTARVRASTRRSKRTGKKSKVKAFNRKNNLDARPFMITTEPLLNDIENVVLKDVSDLFDNSKNE